MNVIDSFRRDGRTAIVTGGAGRYGKQISEALAEAGAEVFIAARHVDASQAFADTLVTRGLKAHAIHLDLESTESIDKMVADIMAQTGRIDILINNAVTRCGCGGGWKKPLDSYDESLHVNASALFYITAAVSEVMKTAGKGSIVNIGSFMGLVGPEFANYAGTTMGGNPNPIYFYEKGGMVNFTRWAASVLGKDGIRVNAIHPGGLMENTLPERFVKQYSERTQLGHLAGQEDLKGIIVFLASDASGYITGTNIPVDGGYTAK
ncbi:MAG: SDR family oxidoreductase [Victivallales bacterium]|nr:SDR family oxidoreductase [Victivallales bacterium]